MGSFLSFLRSFFGPNDTEPVFTPEQLRDEFQVKYYHFKLLLTANTRTMGLMAEIEEALHGTRTFGLPFVRSATTALAVGVFRMIKSLDAIAPGQYRTLSDRFKDIQASIETALKRPGPSACVSPILPLSGLDNTLADQVGTKMAGLGEIRKLGLPVPDGFVITGCAFARFMEHGSLGADIEAVLAAGDHSCLAGILRMGQEIQERIRSAEVPADLARGILEAARAMQERCGPDLRLCLRASPLGEGLAGRSFSGQFRPVLSAEPEDILDAWRQVVSGKYGVAAMSYRLARGIPEEDVVLAVGVAALVQSRSGGLACSRNPLDLSDSSVHIESAWGHSKTVAEGSGEWDHFVVSRTDPPRVLSCRVARKETLFVCDPEDGTCRSRPAGDLAEAPSLTGDQPCELARLALTLEETLRCPVDLEWAMDEQGGFTILGCRPLTRVHIKGQAARTRREDPPGPVLLEGRTAVCPGVGCGPVRVVRQSADIPDFPEGGVLVSVNALPKWAALLDRASAVVTEYGSPAGSLADAAQQAGVPALFGAPEATSLLADGQTVTVDADGLTVYAGRLEALLSAPRPRKRGMRGTPVHDLLTRAAEFITPLNLTDPDAPTFRPRHCRTLHDITRLCHEKAVQEMFSFGQEHSFSERAAKQLVTETTTQWWLINLDDGFKHEVPGAFVRLEDIDSLPFLAVWEGISAFPWAGPPPINARGLMSIMYESTTNPDLLTTSHGNFSARNYFMLSRQYVSLSSRFGYHFTIIEGLVGDRPCENFIGFQFRGGAAEAERRTLRIHFVTEILEGYGFGLEMKGDSLFARVEGRERRHMVERLMILGYLIIHTRQLDMIMKIPAEVRKHKEKIRDEIKLMLGNSALLASLDAAGEDRP